MKKDMLCKTLVMGIVVLFIGACVVPGIGGKDSGINVDEESPVTTSGVSNSATLSLHTFDKTGEKQKKDVVIPADAANEIYDMLEELRYKIVYEPRSDETQALKNEFVDLLDKYDLIPGGLSKDYVLSLLNPSWLNNKQKIPRVRPVFPILRNFVSRILGVFLNLQQFFKMRFGKTASQDIIEDILPSSPYSETGTATFCSIGSGGRGGILPLFLLPRPRGIAVWSATEGFTAAAELLSPVGAGFGAEGAQSGLALGFIGLGLTFAIPGEMVYGFVGYALFTSVSADNIVFFPPNEAPIISNEKPPNGAVDVPLSLSELSFRISDSEGKLMSYTVTTDPDIGSGSGILKPDGVYSVPVSGLEYDKIYSWTVEVKDDQVTAVKQFSFYTVAGPPFDPFDDGWQYRKEITVDHMQVAGSLSDFTVLISTIDSDLRDKAQNDGDDILFMDDTGVATKLYHEIEYYDGSSGELVAWVRIPSLSSSVDTVLYMYYGNSGCSSQQFVEKVWDSNYIHVWHLGDSLSDSSGSDDGNNHGTSIVSGKIGMARDFETSESDFIDCGDMSQPADDSLTTMTWECWVKPETQDTEIMTKYDSSGTDFSSYFLEFESGGKFGIAAASAWNVDTKGYTDDSYSVVGQWFYLTATFTLGGINDVDAFINGNEVAFTHFGSSADVMWDTGVSDDIGRGRYEGGTGYADAVIDEIRWSKVVRSDAWISTSYNTMNDPSSFFSVGSEESAP